MYRISEMPNLGCLHPANPCGPELLVRLGTLPRFALLMQITLGRDGPVVHRWLDLELRGRLGA